MTEGRDPHLSYRSMPSRCRPVPLSTPPNVSTTWLPGGDTAAKSYMPPGIGVAVNLHHTVNYHTSNSTVSHTAMWESAGGDTAAKSYMPPGISLTADLQHGTALTSIKLLLLLLLLHPRADSDTGVPASNRHTLPSRRRRRRMGQSS